MVKISCKKNSKVDTGLECIVLDVSDTTVAFFSKDKICKCITAFCLVLDIDPIYPKFTYAPRRDWDLVIKRQVKLQSNAYPLLKVDRER